MAHFCKIENNIVQQVIVADTQEWCDNNLGGEWVETFMDKEGHNYASIGFTYVKEKNNFCGVKPYKSWTLDENLKWNPPVPMPETGRFFWDETLQTWETNKMVN